MGIRLTEKTVRDLPLGSGIHRDEVVKGMFVQAHKTTKTYMIQTDLRRNKQFVKSIRLKIDRCDRISLSDARNQARSLLSQIQSGVDPTSGPSHSSLTLQQVLDYHLKERELSQQTHDNYNYHVSKYLKRYQKKQVADISRQEARDLLDRLIAQHGRTTAATVMRTLRTLLNTAKRLDETIKENPIDYLKLPPVPKRKVEELDVAEFWKNTSELTPIMRDLERMFLLTGARRGSLLPARRQDVDLEKGILTFGHMKTGGELMFPLGQRMIELLRNRLAEDEPLNSLWVWPSATSVSGHIEEPKRHNIPSPHKLRHSARTLMIAAGVPYAESALLVGHKLPGASGSYVHPSHLVETLRPFVQRYEDHLFSLI